MSSQDVKSSKEQRSSTDVSQESSKHVDGSIERLQLKSSTYRSGSQYVFTFVCAVIASLAALAILRRKDPTTELPDAYAVCARESKIYTVDGGSPQVECIGVRAGEIFATGPIAAVKSAWKISQSAVPVTEEANLIVHYIPPGQIIVPGLADAHAHVLQWGQKMQLPLDGAESVQEVVRRVRQYILDRPHVLNDTSIWIEGMGWDQTRWAGQQFPTSNDLSSDPILRGRPIALKRVDVHATWVSNRALDIAKEAAGGSWPEVVNGGEIVRDTSGNPTGVFIDNAMDLIPSPPWTDLQMNDFFERTMKDALQHGLTSIHDAWSDPSYIDFFKKIAEEGSLPLRLYLMAHISSPEYWGKQLRRMENYGKHHRLTSRAVKLFTDGALGSWGAALLQPYSDRPDFSGILRTDPQVLEDLVTQFWQDDFQVNIHCIGDKANNVVLDIFEKMIYNNPNKDARPRIEHAQIMTQHDLQRIGRLGVIASVQPTHATSDMGYAEARLGPDRIRGAYAYQTLLNVSRGNILPLGSDFPVEGINPLLGFYAATTRLSSAGTSPHGPGGWFPKEKLTRMQALKGMTYDAAYASFAEDRIGSLEPGKKADFVILDKDIITVPQEELLQTKVVATIIDGQIAYGSLAS